MSAMTSKAQKPKNRDGFRIAIICALKHEADAAEAMFDEIYERDGTSYGKADGDSNTYRTGAIGQHNVILARVAGMGKVNCARVAENVGKSFKRIRLAIVVGVCGAAPDSAENHEIILGDVLISTKIIQWDYGRQTPQGLEMKDTLEDSPSKQKQEIRGSLEIFDSITERKEVRAKIEEYVRDVCQDEDYDAFAYPGSMLDILYKPEYRHKHQNEDAKCICKDCKKDADPVCEDAKKLDCKTLGCLATGTDQLVPRKRLPGAAQPQPRVHFGTIACGDGVVKTGSFRDHLSETQKVIGFEMEGIGAWETYPTLVMKAACDYADTHKNKKFQNYAAMTAAACMKAFLGIWRPTDEEESSASSTSRAQAQDVESRNSRNSGGGGINVTFGTATVRDNAKINQIGNQTVNGNVSF